MVIQRLTFAWLFSPLFFLFFFPPSPSPSYSPIFPLLGLRPLHTRLTSPSSRVIIWLLPHRTAIGLSIDLATTRHSLQRSLHTHTHTITHT
ncbi:hypothetical protein LZ30DRAFT_244390 [Colletotrichum cereale]|nr:hypothetical protein LZ30DRAFT_244390 [Colletotrichum cereale]